MMLAVNEVYRAIQGEGPYAGHPCVFVRLQGCPVHCAWCDTAYTWDGSEKGEKLEVADVLRRALVDADGERLGHCVVTGGEPLAQSAPLAELLEGLLHCGLVEVETAGIHAPPMPIASRERIRWNVSPKLPSARARLTPDLDILREFRTLDSIPRAGRARRSPEARAEFLALARGA